MIEIKNHKDFAGGGMLVAGILLMPVEVSAQTDMPNSEKDESKTSDVSSEIETVTVKGKKSPNRADRQVYNVRDDPEAATQTVGDALNKVPGVSVDPEGRLTLRGNGNVKLLVNGRDSAMSKGENRALLLQSMSAGALDSIEVMTNPSAQYGSDGAGGDYQPGYAPGCCPGHFRCNAGEPWQ